MDVGLPDLDGWLPPSKCVVTGTAGPSSCRPPTIPTRTLCLALVFVVAMTHVGKPFRFVVQKSLTRSQLREHQASEDAEFQVGPYTFRPTFEEPRRSAGRQIRG